MVRVFILGIMLGLSGAVFAAPPIPAQELASKLPPAKAPMRVEVVKKSPPGQTLAGVVASAKPHCYSEAQYRAEQAVRYQTQLMVAGMLCQSMSPASYSNYQAFTQRNETTVARAENVLIGWFREHNTPQPELSIHTLRTNMANDISIKAMQQSLPVYCRLALPRLKEAAALQPRQFETYLTKIDLRQTSTRPVCSAAVKTVPISMKNSP